MTSVSAEQAVSTGAGWSGLVLAWSPVGRPAPEPSAVSGAEVAADKLRSAGWPTGADRPIPGKAGVA